MLKYRKIINEETKECEVGLGTNAAFYKSIGMELGEVDQAYDGRWFVFGYAPKKSLEELKTEKRAGINQARDEAEQGGFEYMGKIFDSDQVSCQRMSMAAQAMSMVAMSEETPTITWTCQDNTTIELNAQQLLGLVVALAEWSNSCHKKATELKSRIDLATTEDELNQIVWEN